MTRNKRPGYVEVSPWRRERDTWARMLNSPWLPVIVTWFAVFLVVLILALMGA